MEKKQTVLITDYIKRPASIETQALGDGYQILFLEDAKTKSERIAMMGEADAILVWHHHLDREFLGNAKKCKFIVRYGVGFDNVDTKAAQDLGMAFSNNPDYGVHEVSDTAVAFMMAANRKIFAYRSWVFGCPKEWQEQTLPPIRRLTETQVGIVGLGRIGGATALKMKALGAKVSFYDPYKSSGTEKTFGIERCSSLEGLVEKSDLLSIHCPLTPETSGMINSKIVAHLPKGASIINTARGPIITDFENIFAALEADKLYGLYLDTLPEEPPRSTNSALKKFLMGEGFLHLKDRVVITPHTAYFSDDAYTEMRKNVGLIIRDFFEKGIQRNKLV